jgi:hypothetical protein
MNWTHQSENKLENLPRFEKFEDDHHWDSYWGQKMPWARMKRWFESQEGVHVDVAFSKFVNLKWLLQEYRTKEQFNRFVETNTFFGKDNKIYYYCKYRFWHKASGEGEPVEGATKTIYVHPTTKKICVYRPQTRESYRKQWQAERDAKVRILGAFDQLYKEQGIWFRVQAQPVIDFTKTSLNDARLGKKKADSILLETTNNSDGSFVKITLKRQLNSKELKKFGLTND